MSSLQKKKKRRRRIMRFRPQREGNCEREIPIIPCTHRGGRSHDDVPALSFHWTALNHIKQEKDDRFLKLNTPCAQTEQRPSLSILWACLFFINWSLIHLSYIGIYATMPEERVGEETVCFREHYITWRGLILFLQRISQKEKKKERKKWLITDCISQNALEVMEALQTWYCR